MNKFTCHLYDLMSANPQESQVYTSPIYTKHNGVYGYLCVSGLKVYFFWYNDNDFSYDDVSTKFKVEYLITQENETNEQI